jgi:hypothetical protein
MHDVLIELPPWLFGNIVREWVTTTSLAFLDRAYCVRDTRDILHRLFEITKIVLQVDTWLTGRQPQIFARWVVKRKMAVARLAFANFMSPCVTVDFVHCVGGSLTSIKLMTTPILVSIIGATCRNIRDAELFECGDLQAVGVFLCGVHATIERLVLVANHCKVHSDKPTVESSMLPKLTALFLAGDFNHLWTTALVNRCPVLQTAEFDLRANSKLLKPPPTLKKVTMRVPNVDFGDIYDTCLFRLTLEALWLIECTSVTVSTISRLFERNPLLYAIAFTDVPSLSDRVLAVVVQKVPTIRCFKVDGCCNVTAAGMAHLLEHCNQLNNLSVACAAFDLADSRFLGALRSSVGLQSFNVSENALDLELINVIAGLPNLKELGAHGVRFTTTRSGLDHIARNAPRLRTVGVSRSTSMFAHVARRMWEAEFPHIKLVYLYLSEFWEEMTHPAPNVEWSADSTEILESDATSFSDGPQD